MPGKQRRQPKVSVDEFTRRLQPGQWLQIDNETGLLLTWLGLPGFARPASWVCGGSSSWAKSGDATIYFGEELLFCPGLKASKSPGLKKDGPFTLVSWQPLGQIQLSFPYRVLWERMTKEKQQPRSRQDQERVKRIHGSLCGASSSSSSSSPPLLLSWLNEDSGQLKEIVGETAQPGALA